MEANLETVETHFKSKKYYLAKSYQDFDITKYEQNYMIPHKDHPKKVYCTLTGASKYCLFFKKWEKQLMINNLLKVVIEANFRSFK